MNRIERNAAVLFANIAGSTRLFETAGDKNAQDIVREWVRQVRGLLPQFEGRLIKTVGGEAMCAFPDADKALLAAGAIQAAVAEAPPAGYEIALHIGMHYGSVIIDSDDMFGDTVNVAAFLAAVALPQQVMIADSTRAVLSAALKSTARPVFRTVLKGQNEAAVVYEVLWQTNDADTTNSFFSSRPQPLVQGDAGGLIVRYGERSLHLNNLKPRAVLGRHSACDLVVRDLSISRQHASIELQGMNFFLIDRSINGSFVLPDGLAEVTVLRREFLLDGPGKISLGHGFSENPAHIIEYARDRRSLFRT